MAYYKQSFLDMHYLQIQLLLCLALRINCLHLKFNAIAIRITCPCDLYPLTPTFI